MAHRMQNAHADKEKSRPATVIRWLAIRFDAAICRLRLSCMYGHLLQRKIHEQLHVERGDWYPRSSDVLRLALR